MLSAAAITELDVVWDPKPLGQPTCVNLTVATGTDMIVNIYFGDVPSTNFTTFVLDPVSFPTDYCFNHTYVTAGTYDVTVMLSNNRSEANHSQVIDVDSLFTCNLTLNHSEYQVTEGLISLSAPGATRLAITVDFGDGVVLAEGPSNGIDCFDPIVGEKTWNRTYNATGLYDIEVNASNSHDSCSLRGVLGVNEKISNLTVNTTGNTNLTDTTFFLQTIEAGSNVVCEHHFDDNLVTIHYCEVPDPVFEFNHTYAEIGFYQVKIICYNYLDVFEFPFDIYVQIPIEGFTMNDTSPLLRYGDPHDIHFSMQNGTNVTVFSTFNGINATSSYNFDELLGYVTIDSYPAGFSTMNISAFNEVSRVEESIELQIEKNVSGALVTYNDQSGDEIYFTPADSVQFNLSTEDGTFPNFILDYGDGIIAEVQQMFETVENKTEYEVPIPVQYAEGYYTLNFTAENNVSSETALVLVGVEYPVEDFIVNYANVSDKSTPVSFEIVDASTTTPTSTSILASYQTITETDDETPLVDLASPYTQPHTFQNYGMYFVLVNVSNNVSHVVKEVVVQVGTVMEGLTLTTQQCADTNETVEFLAHVDRGSEVVHTFNGKDDIGPDYIQQEPAQDYSLPWNHTFNYSYPLPGIYYPRVNASSPLNTLFDTTQIRVQNSLNGTTFPQPEPQSLTSGDPAQFIFDAEFVPTNASCVFIHGDDSSNAAVDMAFTGLQFIQTHSYALPGTYTLQVSCMNCKTDLNATYDVDVDYEIADTSMSVNLVMETNYDYGIFCFANIGSRIRHSLYYDNETLAESTVVPDLTKVYKFFYRYTAPTNTTVRCRFNNSVSDLSEMQDVIVQHRVNTIDLRTQDANGCVLLNSPAEVIVDHSPSPHPTDPFLSWTTSDGQSGYTYSQGLMDTGTDSLWVTYSTVENVTITVNTSNLFNFQVMSFTFAVQSVISSFDIVTATGIPFAAVDEETLFIASIIGSHAEIETDWGDGVTNDPDYLDGLLDGIDGPLTHEYGAAQAGTTVTINAAAINCYTAVAVASNSYAIEIQHKVNFTNMVFDYPNPVTSPDSSIEFNITVKAGMYAPTVPRCRINYTDLQNNQHDIFPDGPVNSLPWVVNYVFPIEVQVEVQLEIYCWNEVSSDTHTERLILEQPIEDLDIAIPAICETKVPCLFNITMTSGNNLNVTVSITDSTDPQNFLQLEAETAIPQSHIFQNQSMSFDITVRAFNHINDSSVTRSVETRHTVKNLQISYPEFVNLKQDNGFLEVEVAAGGGEVPSGVMISLVELGTTDVYDDANWNTYIATVRYDLTTPQAYDMLLRIENVVTQKEKTFTVYGEYPIVDLTVILKDQNDRETTLFTRNDLVRVYGTLTGHKPAEPPSDVMYWIELPNFQDSNAIASWSQVISSPGDPWICNVTAKNNVTNITTIQLFTVEANFPLLHLEYNETTIVTRDTFINAKIERTFVGEDVAVCFKITFPSIDPNLSDDIQFRGESRDLCKVAFSDFNDAMFLATIPETIDENTYWLNMTFTFEAVGLHSNSSVYGVMLRRNSVTNEFEKKPGDKTYNELFDLDVLDIPCSAPIPTALGGVPGNNITYPQVNLRALSKTFMISQYYSITYDCEKTQDTLISWVIYREQNGEYLLTDLSSCSACREIPMGYNIEKNVLNYTSYIINVSLVMGTEQERYDEFSTWIPIYINVSETPLICSIKVGESVTIGQNVDVLGMEATCTDQDGMYDMEPFSGLTIHKWRCRRKGESWDDGNNINTLQLSGSPAAQGTPGCFGTGPGIIANFENVTTFDLPKASMHAPATAYVYEVELEVMIVLEDSHNRKSTFITEVHLSPDVIPVMATKCISNCQPTVDPNSPYTMSAAVVDPIGGTNYVWGWDVKKQSNNQLQVAIEATNNGSESTLVIQPGNLEGSFWYDLTVTVSVDSSEKGEYRQLLIVNKAPHSGHCFADPYSGMAFETFRFSCEKWADDYLTHEDGYVGEEPLDGENSMGVTFLYSYLAQGQKQYITGDHGALPAGLPSDDYHWSILVEIYDIDNVKTDYSITVQVQPQPDQTAALDGLLNDITAVTDTSIGIDPTEYMTNILAVTVTLSNNQAIFDATGGTGGPDGGDGTGGGGDGTGTGGGGDGTGTGGGGDGTGTGGGGDGTGIGGGDGGTGTGGGDGGTGTGTGSSQVIVEEDNISPEEAAQLSAQLTSIMGVLASVGSTRQPTEIANSLVTTTVALANVMPVAAPDSENLGMITSASRLVAQLGDPDNPGEVPLDEQTTLLTGVLSVFSIGIHRMDAFQTDNLPTLPPDPADLRQDSAYLDNTPSDTPQGAIDAQQREEEYQGFLSTGHSVVNLLNDTLYSAGQAMVPSIPQEQVSISLQEMSLAMVMGHETGASLRMGDTEIFFPPPQSEEEIIYQATDLTTNIYSWDASARDVNGALIYNTYNTLGGWEDPMITGPMRYVKGNEPSAATYIDFTNKTYDNDTGMLYAGMDIESENDALLFEIRRSEWMVAQNSTFTAVFIFNSTNSTDASSSARPNLTNYDVKIDLPVPVADDTPPSAPPLVAHVASNVIVNGPQESVWVVRIPEEHVITGFMQMGVLIDDQQYPDLGNESVPYENRTVPVEEFDVFVLLVRCRTFVESEDKWSSSGCSVDSGSTTDNTQCSCPVLDDDFKSFSTGFKSPSINPIDFNYIFSNFGDLLSESFTVLITLCAITLLYIITAVYVRRLDKVDVMKWTIAPMVDNRPNQGYFYKISVYTGIRAGAGCKSRVCFILSGVSADTGLRVMDDGGRGKFKRGTIRYFVVSTTHHLGHLSFLRIWHDNSGKGEYASWFLDKVEVEDLQNNEKYYFLNGRWLAVDEDDGQVQRLLPVANEEEVTGFNHLFYSTARSKITDDHLWVSVMSRPTRSSFTRVQRLTCCLVLLMSTMIANAMFFGQSSDDPGSTVAFRIGTIAISTHTILISVYSTLVVLPINLIIVTLFRKSKPKYQWELPQDIVKRQAQAHHDGPNDSDVRKILFPTEKSHTKGKASVDEETGMFEKKQPELPQEFNEPADVPPPKEKKWWKKKQPLPHWCVYIGYVLAFLSCLTSFTFCFFYSLQWGGPKSNEWLAALFLSFFQDVILIQPIKVIAIAMAVSLIFKKLDDDDLDDEDRKRNARPTADEELLSEEAQGLYADLKIPPPPDASTLQAARAKRDYDKMMWAIVQEVFFYIFFLFLICFIAWGGKDDMVFYTGKVVHSQFQPVPENFSAAYVSDGFKFWDWAIQTMVSAVYNPLMYNGSFNTVRNRNYMSDMASFKIGPPRLRQLRTKTDTCNLLSQFRHIVKQKCIDAYSISEEEDRDFLPGWTGILPGNVTVETLDQVNRSFTYQSFYELRGVPVLGTISLYGGGGYVAILTRNQNSAMDIMSKLRSLNWIDRQTRAIFLEFTLFNPNTNLFAYVEYLFEFPTIGGVIPRPRVSAFQLYPASGPLATLVLSAQILYIFILIYFIYTESKKVKETGWRDYIKEPWNLFELVLIITSVVGVSMFSLKLIAGQVLTSDLAESLEKYTNYQTFAYYDECVNAVVGVIIFMANVKFLRLLRFNRHILFLSTTMRKAGVELICFSITFLVFFIAYGLMGTVLFGEHLQGFRTLLHTLESLYSMLLGKFDFNGIRQAQSVLGPMFFVTFVMTVYFVLVNMFLGILGIAFYEVRSDTSPMECDKVQFISFSKEQASLFVLSLKELLPGKKDDDDDDNDRLVDSDSIELKDSDSVGPSTSGTFGARPYLE